MDADVELTFGHPDKITMANPTPVEMVDISTGEAVEPDPSAPCSKDHQSDLSEIPKSWPNEIFVLKIRETPPEGCQVASSCTRESCSCNQEKVSQLVTKFCEGLRDVAMSRSQMCPHTVADVLKGELNGVYFTWLERVNDGKDGPVASPPPSGCQESSPTNETTSPSPEGLLISSQSPPTPCQDEPERDTRIHAELYLHGAIYDSLNGNSGTNEGDSVPDELQTLPVIESQVDTRNEHSDSTTEEPVLPIPDHSDSELNTPTAVHDANGGRRVPSLTEKEVPELEGDAGILSTPNLNSASERRLSFDTQLSADPVVNMNSPNIEAPSSPMESNIIIESVSSVRVEKTPNSIRDDFPTLETSNCNEGMELEEGDLRNKQNANEHETSGSQPILERIPGLGDDGIAEVSICSANKQSSSTSDNDMNKNCEDGACKNTEGTSNGALSTRSRSTRRSSTQNGNGTTHEVGASSEHRKSSRVEIKPARAKQKAAPASVKQKRNDLVHASAKQVAENLQKLMSAEPASKQQQPSPSLGGSATDSPLKRKHADDEPVSLSSSPEISATPKKGRLPLLESEDEYDDVNRTKNAPMEVDNNEKDSQKQITVDDSQSVLPGPYLVVPYAASEVSESESSLDNVPLVRRLRSQNGSLPEGTDANSTPGQMLNKSKSANDMRSSLHEEKTKIVTDPQPSSHITVVSDDDDDIEVIAELPHVPGKSKEKGNEKDKPSHINFQSKSLRKRTSAPVESESQIDSNLDNSTSSKKVPLGKSLSLPASSETPKEPESGDTCRQEEVLGKDHNSKRTGSTTTRNVLGIPVIETSDGNADTAATKAKSSSRPPAPPPPIISRRRVLPGSTTRAEFGKQKTDDRTKTNSSSVRSASSNLSNPPPSFTNNNHSDRERSKTPPLQQQPQFESGSTSSEKSTSPVRSRRQIIEEQFDPRTEAKKINQKQVPKVTKAVTESLLQKQPDPLPNIVTSASSKKPTTATPYGRIFDPRDKTRNLAGKEPVQQRKGPPIIPSPSVMLHKKPAESSIQQNSSSQQRSQPARPQPTPGQAKVRLDGGEFRMAPSSTSVGRPSTVSSYRDRNMGVPRVERNGNVSGRENSDTVRNSAADNIPLEYRYSGSIERGDANIRNRETSPRYSTDNRESPQSGRRSPNRSNDNRFTSRPPSPPSPNPLDPRLRNRQPELTEPLPNVTKSRWDNDEEPISNGNDVATPSSSGGGSWERGDGVRIYPDPGSAAGSDTERRSYSPQNRRHAQFDNDFRNEDVRFDSDQDWESAVGNNQRDRYDHDRSTSGDRREGRHEHDHHRIPSHNDTRNRGQRGRGGKRTRPFRGGYRGGGGHYQQDSRPYNRNPGRGGDRGRGGHFPDQPPPPPLFGELEQQFGPPPLLEMELVYPPYNYNQFDRGLCEQGNFPPVYYEIHPQGPPFFGP